MISETLTKAIAAHVQRPIEASRTKDYLEFPAKMAQFETENGWNKLMDELLCEALEDHKAHAANNKPEVVHSVTIWIHSTCTADEMPNVAKKARLKFLDENVTKMYKFITSNQHAYNTYFVWDPLEGLPICTAFSQEVERLSQGKLRVRAELSFDYSEPGWWRFYFGIYF